MRRSALWVLACAALLAAARPAAAFSPPILDFSLGRSFGSDGAPNAGGISAALSPMWDMGESGRFGATLFADDIGTTRLALRDRTSGADLGLVADRHRQAYGLAWRADYDLVRRARWATALSGTAGWWRITDDVRGAITQASSAIGLGLGLEVRHALALRHEAGFAVRYQELTSDRHSNYRRVDHYATAALEWRWTVVPRN